MSQKIIKYMGLQLNQYLKLRLLLDLKNNYAQSLLTNYLKLMFSIDFLHKKYKNLNFLLIYYTFLLKIYLKIKLDDLVISEELLQ